MHLSRILAPVVFVGVIAACADAPVQRATAPDFGLKRVGTASTTPCEEATSLAIRADQEAVFAEGPTFDQARALWETVEADCVSTDAARMALARTAMLEYVRFSIVTWATDPDEIIGQGNQASKAGTITAHWDLPFNYVGYDAPDLGADVLNDGAAKVISDADLTTAGTAGVEFGIPGAAAMTVFKQTAGGDSRSHLFVIYPISGTCLTDNTSLDNSGDCLQFSAFPTGSPTFSPKLKLGLCSQDIHGFEAPALGHFDGTQTIIITPIVYPSASFCLGQNGSPRYGGAGNFLQRLSRLAYSVVAVQPAFASHGGLGGTSDRLSPFQLVELRLFTARFDNVSIGTAPALGAIPSPDKGFWNRVSATHPGSIKVQASLGDIGTQLVSMNQAGGACAACGGLDLWGQLETADETNAVSTGKYIVKWLSVQNHAAPKSAPFVIRSSDGHEIARVAYTRETGTNLLRYNGSALPVGWVKGKAQAFELTVDFTTNETSLKVISNPFGTPTIVSVGPVDFVSGSATNLAKIQAEFSGIDSGTVGWENVIIERLPDE